MATSQTVVGDTPSDEVRILREQVNRLTTQVEALLAATQEADFATFKTTSAGISTTSNVTITVSPSSPTPRRFPTV